MGSRLHRMIFVSAPHRCLGLLLAALLVIPVPPAAAQWWRRGRSAVSYGLRFVDPTTNEPITAPVSQLRVGERHRIAVALYAVRDGELDTSTQLAQSPQGSVTVRIESGNAAVLKIEPAAGPILEDYNRTVAEFWLVGVAPGEARVTAHAALGADATASTWFGPVQVVPAPTATPRRTKRAVRPPARIKPPPADDAGHADKTDGADNDVAQAPTAQTAPVVPATPAEPQVTRNATAIAAPVQVGVALPAPLRERMAAQLPGPVSQPPAQAAPSIVTTLEEALRRRRVPSVQVDPPPLPPAPAEAAEDSADGTNEPLLLPPVPPEPETGLFADVLPGEDTEPTPIIAPPDPGPLLMTSAPRREQAAPAPFAVDDLPSDVDTPHREDTEPGSVTPKSEPLPCPRFAQLEITNVGETPLEVRIRVAGAPAAQVEQVAAGAVLSVALERADTLWVEAERRGGGREGLRLVAGETAVDRALSVPAFAATPWLRVRATLAECAAP